MRAWRGLHVCDFICEPATAFHLFFLQQLTVIPESSCIPVTPLGKDKSPQLSCLRALIFTPIIASLILTRKKSPFGGWGSGQSRKQEGDKSAADCYLGGVVRNGCSRRLGCWRTRRLWFLRDRGWSADRDRLGIIGLRAHRPSASNRKGQERCFPRRSGERRNRFARAACDAAARNTICAGRDHEHAGSSAKRHKGSSELRRNFRRVPCGRNLHRPISLVGLSTGAESRYHQGAGADTGDSQEEGQNADCHQDCHKAGR